MQSSLRHIQSDISTSIRTQSKHKPRAEQKTKQRKILIVLYLQVPEDKSCFVFLSILCLCLCRQCEPGFIRESYTVSIKKTQNRQKINQYSFKTTYCGSLKQAIGPVHTETFSCVFVLFQVMSWLFSIPLRTVNNTKTQENISVCTGP